jgi:hypothetical protein
MNTFGTKMGHMWGKLVQIDFQANLEIPYVDPSRGKVRLV